MGKGAVIESGHDSGESQQRMNQLGDSTVVAQYETVAEARAVATELLKNEPLARFAIYDSEMWVHEQISNQAAWERDEFRRMLYWKIPLSVLFLVSTIPSMFLLFYFSLVLGFVALIVITLVLFATVFDLTAPLECLIVQFTAATAVSVMLSLSLAKATEAQRKAGNPPASVPAAPTPTTYPFP